VKIISYLLNAKNNVLKNKDEKVTSNYGDRTITVNGKRKSGFHAGIDLISYSTKTDYIIAFEDGIISATRDSINGYSEIYTAGNYVYINHEDGYVTKYMHMKKGSIIVKKNQSVKKGDVIGYTGQTGYATGNHLHFSIYKDGKSQNPKPYLLGEKEIKHSSIVYSKGRYIVDVDFLNVRKGVGTNYDKKLFSELSKNAQDQIIKLNGKKSDALCKGVICDVSKISGEWGKIPSGWICLKYCKKIS
jgi:hypothetical protein